MGCRLLLLIQVEIPASVSALIVCIQPIRTVILAGFLLGGQISLKNWIGLSFGFGSAAIVPGVDFESEFAVDGLIVLVAITAGTIW